MKEEQNKKGLLEILGAKTMKNPHHVSIHRASTNVFFSVGLFCETVHNFFVEGNFHKYKDALKFAERLAEENSCAIKDDTREEDRTPN